MKKNLLIIISLIFIVSGCCQDDKVYFIPERKLLNFSENDMFIYKSNLENIDTFTVINKTSTKTEINTIEKFNCTYTEYFDLLEITLSKNNSTNEYDASFSQKNYPEYNFILNWLGHTTNSLNKTFIGLYTVGSITYNNIMLTENTSASNGVSKIHYNEQNGVVSYELISGEKFELIEYKTAK